MSDLPDNDASNFPASWWTKRRRRDYFVDHNNLVQLRPNSPTSARIDAHLRDEARRIALEIARPAGSA